MLKMMTMMMMSDKKTKDNMIFYGINDTDNAKAS